MKSNKLNYYILSGKCVRHAIYSCHSRWRDVALAAWRLSGIEALVENRAKEFNRLDQQLAEQSRGNSPELWGGLECTVNRVGDVFFDQMERNGHATRLSDLERFAGLGIRRIRYPVLWERVAPNGIDAIDWTFLGV